MHYTKFLTIAFITVFTLFASGQKAQAQTEPAKNIGKKNSRPAETKTEIKQSKDYTPVYFYEFSQPDFLVSHIRIEHDETGKGAITLGKKDFDEEYTDPIELSVKAIERLKTLWADLSFLNSEENYQSATRDYPHLGSMTFTMKKDGRERSAKFNWSENPAAQALAAEYKKLANQYVWIFDINVARQNQPLESPRLMHALESHLRTNQISDPLQLIPFLQKISGDERLPLITRNHALRLIKDIEKKNK